MARCAETNGASATGGAAPNLELIKADGSINENYEKALALLNLRADLTKIGGSVKFVEATEGRPRAISSIGIELYGPLPGGVAVGGRFAPEVVKVRGLREIPIEAATRPTR